MSRQNIWMLGDWEQPEFALAVAYLRREANLDLLSRDVRGSGVFGVDVNLFGKVADAKDSRPRTDPDLLLLVASRPGRFSAAEVESLHRRAPLARLIALLGSWCEGEVRSGHPWPGVTRIYAHQWQARLPRELETWQPRTATEIDRLMNSNLLSPKPLRQLIGIAAAQRTMFDALAAACRSFGKDAVWLLPNLPPPVQRVDAVIYDATLNVQAELARLTELRGQLHSPPALLLLNSPRQNDLEQAARAGASSVLAKPYLLADLAAEIERITTSPVSQRLIAAA